MEVAPTSAEARRFGKYELVAKLATGGMAEIFLARLTGDAGFEKLVCIKRILPHLAKDPQFVAMFLDEARVAARISHPNVCQVFELGEWHGAYYISMEYLEGVPLSLFRRTDYYPVPTDPRIVAGFGVQACEGLHHAHQLKRSDGALMGVVHRDISPQNLFVTVDGIVKVLDFGIAKVTDARIKTSTGATKGTYAYMAPEQLRNEKLDRRTDVWAMGIVLWETLAQRHLFKRETEFLTFQAITADPIPDICEVRPDVPPLLGDTIARALSRDREHRFASARALGEALAQAVGPLGGPAPASAISDEMANAFQVTLAEQHTLLRIAREGGAFDLERTSNLLGHGTSISTTPISNLRARVEAAKAEVAQYAAMQDMLAGFSDEHSASGFTPMPEYARNYEHLERESAVVDVPVSRRASSVMPTPMIGREHLHRQSAAIPAQMADWRDSGAIAPPAPAAVRAPSRLPWIIALVAVALAAVAGTVLYLNMHGAATTAPAASATTNAPVTMTATPGAPSAPPTPTTVPPAADDASAVATAPVDAEVAETFPPDAAKPSEKPAETPAAKPAERPHAQHPTTTTASVEPKPSGPPGFITIDSSPVYAVIYIDGKSFGETPLVHISLTPGKHAVRAVSPSGTTRNVTISIESGKTAPVRKIEW